jgi:uncharacterized protein (TIGR02646 family)
MKPVNKGPSPDNFSKHQAAKPWLLNRIGQQCSYCERGGDPQDLDVEHIYPVKPHPSRELDWENFLISCSSCNSYKNIFLGSGRQRNLYRRYLWPHRENTFKAFEYQADGRVEIRPGLTAATRKWAEATREMVGLLRSPAKAANYDQLGVAYDGASKRSQMWGHAIGFRAMYLGNPTTRSATNIADAAANMGYFSIWMEVFYDRNEVRRELIRAFKADRDCFDANTQPITKGRL